MSSCESTDRLAVDNGSNSDETKHFNEETHIESKGTSQVKPLIKPTVLPKPKDIDSLSVNLSNHPVQKPSPSLRSARNTTTTHSTNPPLQKKRSATTVPGPRPDTVIPKPKHVPVVKIVGTEASKKTNVDETEVRKKTLKPKADIGNGNKEELLQRLRTMAQTNDYYSLLGVTPEASREDLSRARRELTAKLHPDHFTGDPEQQTRL